MESKEKIFTEYIGEGQIGIDFTKKDIFEAMDVHARNCMIEFHTWYMEPHRLRHEAERIVDGFLSSDYFKELQNK